MSNERIDTKVKEWNALLEGLSTAKYRLYKYVRIYENTVKHNKKEDLKLLLSIEYRLFKELKDINVSRSHKNSIEIMEYEEPDLYFEGKFMIDAMMAFCDAVSKMIVEKINSGEIPGIAYLIVESRKDVSIVKAIY